MGLKKLKNLSLAIILMFFITLSAKAEINITPGRLIFEVGKNQKYLTGSIQINGAGTEPADYKIYTGYFESTKDGLVVTDFPVGHKKKEVTQIFVNPQQISIKPKEKQTIRFTIPNVNSLPDGESRLVLFVEDKKTRTQALPSPNKKISASLVLRSRFAVPIYVIRGDVSKKGLINTFAVNKTKENDYKYDLEVASKGNAHIRVNGVVQLISKNKIVKEEKINDVAVPVGNTRALSGVFDRKLIETPKNCKIKSKIYYINERNKKVILTKEVKLSPDTM